MVYEGIRKRFPHIPLSKKIRGYIQLLRIFTLIAAILAGFSLNYFFATLSGRETTFLSSLLVGLVLGFLQAGGQSWQQSMTKEVEIDKINKPYRPVVKAIISLNEGKMFSALLFFIGVTLAFVLNVNLGVFALIITFFAVFYVAPPLRMKKRFFLNNLWQGIARGLLPAVYVASAYGYGKFAVLYGIPLMIWVTFCQTTKDWDDIRGDSKYDIKTLPVVLGKERTLKVMLAGIVFSFSILASFIILGYFPTNFFLLLTLLVPSVFIVISLKREWVLFKLENNCAWIFFYACLSLWYLLPVVLVSF